MIASVVLIMPRSLVDTGLLLLLLLEIIFFNAYQTSAYFSSHVVPVSSFPKFSAISSNRGSDVALKDHSNTVEAVKPWVSVGVENSRCT